MFFVPLPALAPRLGACDSVEIRVGVGVGVTSGECKVTSFASATIKKEVAPEVTEKRGEERSRVKRSRGEERSNRISL